MCSAVRSVSYLLRWNSREARVMVRRFQSAGYGSMGDVASAGVKDSGYVRLGVRGYGAQRVRHDKDVDERLEYDSL